jgi:multidrug efflux system membrane fusion protein
MKENKKWVFLILMNFLFSGCGSKDESSAPVNRPKFLPKVTQQEIEIRSVVYEIDAVGSLEAEEEVQIPAGVAGVVHKVFFNEGDQVNPESVLAEIDLDRYRLEANRAQAQLAQVQAGLRNAETAYKRRLDLKEKNAGWVTAEELYTYETNVEKAKADVDRAQADDELAEKNLKDAQVRPPFSGVIDQKSIATGEYVQVGNPIATIRNLNTLRVRFTIPETESGRIRIGQLISFSVKPFPEKVFEAEIFFISSSADSTTRLIECKAKVTSPDSTLKPGFFATIKIETESHEDAIVIPEEAVRPTEQGFIVYTLDESPEGPVARANVVKLGLRTRGKVEILSGLEKGQKIAVLGSDALYDGAKVQVITQEQKT